MDFLDRLRAQADDKQAQLQNIREQYLRECEAWAAARLAAAKAGLEAAVQAGDIHTYRQGLFKRRYVRVKENGRWTGMPVPCAILHQGWQTPRKATEILEDLCDREGITFRTGSDGEFIYDADL